MEKKEVDLTDLTSKFILYFKKHFWFFLIMFIIGSASGILYNKLKKPEYSSDAVISSWLDEHLFIKLLSSFQNQVNNGNYEYLANIIEVSSEDLKSINSMEFFLPDIEQIKPIHDASFSEITGTHTFLSVEFKASDKTSLVKLEEFFHNYFHNNPNLQRLLKQRNELFHEILAEVNYIIENQKNLNESFLSSSKHNNSFIYIEPGMIEYIEVVKLRNFLVSEMDNEKIIYYHQSFSAPVEIKMSMFLLILVFGFGFLFAGMIIKTLKIF